MLRKTMAVGPFDPVASCVTGGAWEASDLACDGIRRETATEFADGRFRAKLLESLAHGWRIDICSAVR
jgi:hypothetical protein